MSFANYLINMGIDVVLGIVGVFGILAAVASVFAGEMGMALIFLIVGGLPLLYTRYRAKKKGITY